MSATNEALLDFIESFVDAHGYPPTTREITAGLGVSSVRIVHEKLVALRSAGKVDWEDHRARTLKIVQPRESQPSGN